MQPVVGTDAGVFEIQPTLAGYSLFIRVGTALDGTTRPALSGAALASDVTLSAPTLPVEFTRNVAGEEPPPPPADGSVTLTGSVRYAGADKAIPGTIVWLAKPDDTSGESALVGSSVRDAVTFCFTAENGLNYRLATSQAGDVRSITAHGAALPIQHLAGPPELTGLPLRGADCDGSGGISLFDSGLILRDSLGGQMVTMVEAGRSWIFSPRALEHATLNTDVTDQDFVGLLIGDVSAKWAAGQPRNRECGHAYATRRKR